MRHGIREFSHWLEKHIRGKQPGVFAANIFNGLFYRRKLSIPPH
jgi:hypothetical protein